MDGGGRRHATAPTSLESTVTVCSHVTPSAERDTTRSAVLSFRSDHQTAYQSPLPSRARRTLAAHCPANMGGLIDGGAERPTSSRVSTLRSAPATAGPGSGVASLQLI